MVATQNLQRECWGRGFRLRQRAADWVTHAFREHNKEADMWADKGATEWVDEWVDTAHIAWSEVTGLCGFWDGSCDNGNCGAGIMIKACSDLQCWSLILRSVGRFWAITPWIGVVC